MYHCHKYGFKLSTTEFNRVFRTASVIPAAWKPFNIFSSLQQSLKATELQNEERVYGHYFVLKICLKIYVPKINV